MPINAHRHIMLRLKDHRTIIGQLLEEGEDSLTLQNPMVLLIQSVGTTPGHRTDSVYLIDYTAFAVEKTLKFSTEDVEMDLTPGEVISQIYKKELELESEVPDLADALSDKMVSIESNIPEMDPMVQIGMKLPQSIFMHLVAEGYLDDIFDIMGGLPPVDDESDENQSAE